MKRKPRQDDDEDPEVFLGFGAVHQLRDRAVRGRKPTHPIGFVHFPEKTKRRKAARMQKQRKRKK